MPWDVKVPGMPKFKVREVAEWLQAAFEGGHAFAELHQAHLAFNAGQEDEALAHLREHLTWRVEQGRDTCTTYRMWPDAGRGLAGQIIKRWLQKKALRPRI